MKKALLLLVYALFFMVLGRSLSFIPTVSFSNKEDSALQIKEKVDKFLRENKGKYSVYYKDLEADEGFGVNEHVQMTGASLNKLVIVAYLYEQAGKGKISLEDKVAVQKKDIQDYGTGSVRYNGEGKTYSLRTLAELSLKESDNTAAHLLEIRLGENNVQAFAQKIGMKATDMKNNKTTAQDMAQILELIWENKVTTQALSREMLDYMKDTLFEDRLARFMPKGKVFHKTGDAVNMVHDVGIILQNNGAFILSILTYDVTDEQKTKESIGKIAKIIYDARHK